MDDVDGDDDALRRDAFVVPRMTKVVEDARDEKKNIKTNYYCVRRRARTYMETPAARAPSAIALTRPW